MVAYELGGVWGPGTFLSDVHGSGTFIYFRTRIKCNYINAHARPGQAREEVSKKGHRPHTSEHILTPPPCSQDLAHHFFSRCLEAKVVPYVVTKKTVFKWQVGGPDLL